MKRQKAILCQCQKINLEQCHANIDNNHAIEQYLILLILCE